MDFSSLFFTENCEEIVEKIPEALFLEDSQGNILEVNKEACHMLGYEREELLEMNVGDLVPQDVLADLPPRYLPDQLEETTQFGPIESINLRKDGTKVPIELRGRAIEVRGEKRILVSVRDVTERKERERRLEQYAMAVEESEDLIAACNPNYDYLFANEAYRDLYQMDGEEILGEGVEDVVGKRRFAEEVKPHIDRCLAGERVEYEMSRTHPDPELGERLLKIIYYPLKNENKIHGVVAVMRDITERRKAKESLKEERERLRQLHDVVDQLQRQNTEDEVLQTAVEMAEEVLGFDICVIDLVEDGFLIPKAISSELNPAKTTKFKIGEGIAGKSVQKGETIWGDDVRDHPEAKPTSGSFRAFISAPIGEIGNFEIVSEEAGSFDKGDVEMAEILANHLQEEIKRIRFEKQLRQKADSIQSTKDRLERLHEVARELESAKEKEEIYQLAVTAAEETLNFLFCSLGIVKGNKLITKATSSSLPPDGTKTMTVEEGVSGKTYRNRETYVYGDIQEVEEAEPVQSEYRACISVPIGDIGVFQVVSKKVDAFTEEDVRLVELLVGHVFEALRRVQLEEQLKEQAIKDPLTGLYNRRYLTETLQREVERSRRYGEPIAFLMIDVNRFKEINDRYSHHTGDQVLKEMARILQENVRGADTVVRYGGDEFLVMMPETDGEVEKTLARLKERVAQWNEDSHLLDFPLTLAMGVAHWGPGQRRDVEEALKEADKKMYRDKGGER